MEPWLLLLACLLGLSAIWALEASWLAGDTQRFLTPDKADRNSIARRFGATTPEGRQALARRFGPDDRWHTVATVLSGLAGILLLLWLLLG